jgi:hypothetical protein
MLQWLRGEKMGVKLIQLTNPNIGAVAANDNLPLGTTTVVYPKSCNSYEETYSIAYSGSDMVKIGRPGTYRVVYNASLVATDAGNLVLELVVNGTTKYTVTTIATAGGAVNLTIPYEVYLPCNCASNPANIPVFIQIKSTGVAITSGTSNLIVSKE